MSEIGENCIEDPGNLDTIAMDLFNGVDVDQTSDVWENLDGQRPVDDDVAADPDEEAVKNAEVVFEFKVPTTRSGNRTRNASEASSSGCKKRRKTKLDDFGGDKKAHLRHRKMNNESVKRCREKKKQQHEALVAGYQEKEEDLNKAKTEIETLKATIKKLYAAYNDVANKNMAAEVLALKSALQEKDEEIAGLKLERDCGFAEVDRLERALRPYKHHEFEQTWGTSITAMDNEQECGNGMDVNNEELFNQVINE